MTEDLTIEMNGFKVSVFEVAMDAEGWMRETARFWVIDPAARGVENYRGISWGTARRWQERFYYVGTATCAAHVMGEWLDLDCAHLFTRLSDDEREYKGSRQYQRDLEMAAERKAQAESNPILGWDYFEEQ